MENNIEIVEVLNDLIKINNDRVVGYIKAADQLTDKDEELKLVFHKMANQSSRYIIALKNEVTNFGGESTTETTVAGKIFRVWMDVKATFTGTDATPVLDSCEYGEDAAQKAYASALEEETVQNNDVKVLIVEQKSELLEAHNEIKKYRDLAEKNSN